MLNLHCKDLQYFQISIDVRFPKSYGCWQWAKPKWGGGGIGHKWGRKKLGRQHALPDIYDEAFV